MVKRKNCESGDHLACYMAGKNAHFQYEGQVLPAHIGGVLFCNFVPVARGTSAIAMPVTGIG